MNRHPTCPSAFLTTRCLVVFLAMAFAASATTLYVAPSGNDLNDGLSAQTPLQTVNTAVATLGSEGGTILLADGTYEETAVGSAFSAIEIVAPITLESISGNAEDCILTKSGGNIRVLKIDHANAIVRNIKIQGGNLGGDDYKGGNVYIGTNGGTVEDCIIHNGQLVNTSNTNGGGNLFMEAGRVSRCRITNGRTGNMRHYASGALLDGGVIESCLITGGVTTHHGSSHTGDGALVVCGTGRAVNCLVTGNTGCFGAGLWVIGTRAKAINCITYANKTCGQTHTQPGGLCEYAWKNSRDASVVSTFDRTTLAPYFDNCASEESAPNNTCLVIDDTAFTDAANGDWTIADNSPLFDAGASYAESGGTSAFDLAGNPRILGATVDIGCFEKASDFFIAAAASKNVGTIPSDAEIEFTATPYFANGTVTYAWDFGDGSSLTTTVATVSHEYVVAGTYHVSVVATCSSSTYSLQLEDPIYISGFSCSFLAPATPVLVGDVLTFEATDVTIATPVTFVWNFGDGTTTTTTETTITHAYATAGTYIVSVMASAGAYGSFVHTFPDVFDIRPRDLYVRASGGSNTSPYDTPAKATPQPQAAIDAALPGCIVHIAAGTYNLRNIETVVNKAITVVGEGASPEATVLQGYGNNSGTRNLRVTDEGALVYNLTCDGGFCGGSPGGGNLLLQNGTVSNCVLRSGRTRNGGADCGGARVQGGLLTHCVITNSFQGNRGNAIILSQSGGRVSNCLLGYNKLEWDNTRNAFSLVYVSGGSIDNCTIVGGRILKNDPDWPAQMGGASDKGVNIGANAYATNVVIADLHYISHTATERSDILNETVSTWAGTAANFVNCATDDASPINETCRIGTTATLFNNYAAGDLVPKQGGALSNHGVAVADAPAVDLAGNPRISGSAIDIGCYENQIDPTTLIIFR